MSLNSRASEVSSQMTLEANNANLSNNKSDEHNLIAEYCQMLNERKDDHPADLEASIKDLESERRALMAEYRDLTKHVTSNNPEITIERPPEDDADDDDIEEQTKQLRQQTSRMETRMKILMDHNGQLEMQLQRLRQLVRNDHDHHHGSGGGQFGTLQSKSIVAQDLNVQSPTRNGKL